MPRASCRWQLAARVGGACSKPHAHALQADGAHGQYWPATAAVAASLSSSFLMPHLVLLRRTTPAVSPRENYHERRHINNWATPAAFLAVTAPPTTTPRLPPSSPYSTSFARPAYPPARCRASSTAPPRVTSDKRKAVEQAIPQLDFRPNLRAQPEDGHDDDAGHPHAGRGEPVLRPRDEGHRGRAGWHRLRRSS